MRDVGGRVIRREREEVCLLLMVKVGRLGRVYIDNGWMGKG